MLWWKKHLAKDCGYSKDYWWWHEVSRGLNRKMLNQGNGRNIQQRKEKMEMRGLELMLAGDWVVVVNLLCIWWWVTTGLNHRAYLEVDGLRYHNSGTGRVPERILLNLREILMTMRALVSGEAASHLPEQWFLHCSSSIPVIETISLQWCQKSPSHEIYSSRYHNKNTVREYKSLENILTYHATLNSC